MKHSFTFLLSVFVAISAQCDTTPSLDSVFASQTNIQTWTADFVQTRTLKTLKQPLISRGKVWFAAPNLFRWELGSPPQTIAVRQTNQMLLIYPALKRAEKYSTSENQKAGWKDMLSVLEVGFPRRKSDLEAKFRVESKPVVDNRLELTLAPKSAAAKRFVSQIQLTFSTDTATMLSTELKFSDGSTLRNDFTNSVVNPKLDEKLFEPKLDADYKVVEPFK